MDTWYAVFAPAGTPAPVVARLRAAMDKVRVNPELVGVLIGQGITPINQPLKAFEDQLRRDFEIWPGLLQRICSQSSCL
jgi:tripartite-type tricarboxylate transporter receptor subunit TctC